jgi:general secretion pathway protein D
LAGLLNGIFASSGNVSTGNTSTTAATKANVSGASTTVTAKKSPTIEATGAISGDFEGEITILPDPDTNSLIIRTSPRNYPAILALINKLDLSPQQVLIEVLIVDLTIDNSTAAGLELAITNPGGPNGKTVAGGISSTTDKATSLGGSIGSATASFLRGGSYFIGQPDKIIAQLQLFASDSKTNVLANPILVTSDNKAANISITDEIPIVQEASVPSGGAAVVTSTVEFRSVGIKLDITPKINSKNFINLRISQEISSLGAEASNGQPSFNTRQVNTEVVLKDNQVLVMGGLMRTDTTDTTTGVPFFKDLPYIGKLFGSESTSLKKTELMIFITPHVISNADDSEFVTSEFKKRLTNLKSIQHLGS